MDIILLTGLFAAFLRRLHSHSKHKNTQDTGFSVLIHQHQGMKMKNVFICSLLFVSLSLHASQRSELEHEVAETLGFKETARHSFIGYKKQLVEVYSSLVEDYFESKYGLDFQYGQEKYMESYMKELSVFNDEELDKYGKERYMESYIKGLSVYSDEELRKLINFYQSDEGKWIIKKNLESNAIVLDDLKKASDDFNKVFIERMQSLK